MKHHYTTTFPGPVWCVGWSGENSVLTGLPSVLQDAVVFPFIPEIGSVETGLWILYIGVVRKKFTLIKK